jgi:hypothetical protein
LAFYFLLFLAVRGELVEALSLATNPSTSSGRTEWQSPVQIVLTVPDFENSYFNEWQFIPVIEINTVLLPNIHSLTPNSPKGSP